MKRLHRWLLWVADGIWYALLLVVVAVTGCASLPAVRPPPIPVTFSLPERAAVVGAATVLPAKRMGCEWDYDALEPGMMFEVWSSTNLVSWVLATNTTEKIALFPVKQMEFYKVRAKDEHGLVSDWATVRK